MKAIICEMCGSNNIVKKDGVFECQKCGTKYSVEEARKLMTDGPLQVDSSHLTSNYMEMTKNAYSSGNYSEAELYCNKIIETDPQNYEAFLYKGLAAGWQSSLTNNRISESVTYFSYSIQYAPEKIKPTIVERAKEELIKLSIALITVRENRFVKWPDRDEANGLRNDLSTILDSMIQFAQKSGVVISTTEMMKPIANIITEKNADAFKTANRELYSGLYPDIYDCDKMINRIDLIIELEKMAVDLCDDDFKADIERYDMMIFYEESAIKLKWYRSQGDLAYGRGVIFLKGSEIAARQKMISQFRASMEMCKEKVLENEKKKRIDKYWIMHKEEKETLEKELAEIMPKVEMLEDELAKIDKRNGPSLKKLNQQLDQIISDEIQTQSKVITELSNERNNLSVFKSKEKKEIANRIETIEMPKLRQIEKKAKEDRLSFNMEIGAQILELESEGKDMRDELALLKKRKTIIETELTKDRDSR